MQKLFTSNERWGNPEGGEFQYVDFGAVVDEESRFEGYVIPTRLRVGWYLESHDSRRFESEGEFFRCVIEEARFT